MIKLIKKDLEKDRFDTDETEICGFTIGAANQML